MTDFQLGHWKVSPEINTISDKDEVRIEPQVMEVLCCLARRPGRVVSKEELIEEVWQGRFVGDEAITNSIWELRRALGDDARRPTFIQTIPKRGYRLIAKVVPLEKPTPGRQAAPLGRMIVGVAAILVVGCAIAAAFWIPGHSLPPDADSRATLTVGVFPFSEMDGESYFGQGLSEALAGEMARLPYLRIVAPASTGRAAELPGALDQVARRLDAGVLLQGTVHRETSQVRLVLQLIAPEDGTVLWSEAFVQEDSRLPLLIGEAARATAQQLSRHFATVPPPPVELVNDLEKMRRKPVIGRQAYEDYLRGLYFWRTRRQTDLRRAVEFFERAIRQAPDYAAAYAGLANAHIILADHLYAPSRSSLDAAEEAAAEALRLDPESAEALTAMAWILWVRDWKWEEAEELFRRALRLNPSYSTGHHWFSALLEVAGRTGEAVYHAGEAQRLSVLSPIVHATAGTVVWSDGRREEAVRHYLKAFELDPDFVPSNKGLFWAAVERGDMDEAQRHCLRLQRQVRRNDDWRPYSFRFQLEGACRPDRLSKPGYDRHEFDVLAEGLRRHAERGFVSPMAWFELHAGAGHVEETHRWLKATIQTGSRHVFQLPRYLEIQEKATIFNDPLLTAELKRIPFPPKATE